MGMSIDKAIKKLKGQQADFNEQYIDYGRINDAFFTAYEVMRKYQKIQEIIADWKSDGGAFEMSESYWLRLISEVLEDGKIS